MFTPRSVFVLLVLAQLVAFSLGEILGTLRAGVIVPLWRKLMGPSGSMFTIEGMNLGAIIGGIALSILCLVLGIYLFAQLVQRCWPWLARTLQIESPGK